MNDVARFPSRRVVLLGLGHTNAHVLRSWGMQPIPDTDLTCITDNLIATYSGMLPAALAGQVSIEQMQIDLVRLCAKFGVRLIQDRVTGLDLAHRMILLAERPPVPFDVLSIGIGSVPASGVGCEAGILVRTKPMQSFLERLKTAVRSALGRHTRPLRIVVVGSGVAGIEIAFCLPAFLRTLDARQFELQIVTSSRDILPDVRPWTRRLVLEELRLRGVCVTVGDAVTSVSDPVAVTAAEHCKDAEHGVGRAGPGEHQAANAGGRITLASGATIYADVVIWATGASPPDVLGELGLPLDTSGFLATDHTLRCVSGDPVFAVGDCGTIVGEQLPKAGVYAVRQGPILWENIARILGGRSLLEYRPQREFLRLINLGDGRAVGQWRWMSLAGKWVMRWKDRIDTRFVNMYQPRPMAGVLDPMQCRGCGSKLGSAVLRDALDRAFSLKKGIGDLPFEDAAVIAAGNGVAMLASTDFFSAPFDDAYLTGRITALHAASDVLVSGARPTQALANVVVLDGDRESQHQYLKDFLAGARREFHAMGAEIVGGHTIVGPRLEVGFTVIGNSPQDRIVRKANLQIGDELLLTKPIGIGVLLASLARGHCSASNYQQLIAAMLAPQAILARIAVELGIDAATDVTGFGLAGHLLEMLEASDVAATLVLDSIPILKGAADKVALGIESSLFEDNFQVDSKIDALAGIRARPEYRLLFDPQTCGGFLLGCTPSQADELCRQANQANAPVPQRVGFVRKFSSNMNRLAVVRAINGRTR